MGLYDNYRLQNSQLVKQYAGSPLNELVSVGKELQGRFDYAREAYDTLGSAVDSSKVFDADKAMFQETMNPYRQAIAEAAKSGRYEDMVFNVNKLARKFATDYKPFAENLQRVQAYQSEVDQALEKGTIKNPETAARLKQLALSNYKGLTRGEDGQMTGFFSGPGIAKQLDYSEWADKKAKDIAAQTLGESIERVEGDMYVTRSGKRISLTDKRIQDTLRAAMEIDPEFQGSLKQDVSLASMGAENITQESLPENSPLRQQVEEYANSRGLSFGQAFKEMKARSVAEGIIGNTFRYASKYRRDDHESGISLGGMTEQAKKKLDDLAEPLGFTINARLNEGASTVDEIFDQNKNLNDQIAELGQKWTADSKNLNKIASSSGVKDGNGTYRYTDNEGNDVTHEVILRKNQMDSLKAMRDKLVNLDKQARKIAGVSQSDVEDSKKAGDYFKGVFSALKGVPMVGDWFKSEIDKGADAVGRGAQRTSMNNSATGKRYTEALKSLAGEGTAVLDIKRTTSNALNKAMEEQFNALVSNLDGEDLKGGYLGLQYGSGENMFGQLKAEDYGKLKGNAQYAGYFTDPNTGALKVMYKFPGEKGEAATSVIANAPTGLVSHLLKAKEPEMANLAIAQQLGVFNVESDSAKRTIIPLSDSQGNKVEVQVRRTAADERANSGGKMYMLEIPTSDGKTARVPAGSISDITAILKHLNE